MNDKPIATLRRWREWRQRRRADRLERKIHARENLRDVPESIIIGAARNFD